MSHIPITAVMQSLIICQGRVLIQDNIYPVCYKFIDIRPNLDWYNNRPWACFAPLLCSLQGSSVLQRHSKRWELSFEWSQKEEASWWFSADTIAQLSHCLVSRCTLVRASAFSRLFALSQVIFDSPVENMWVSERVIS